ncbi:BglG family transcription antiterminator [Zophobihabitans entericus]|uniref:BglG family transcription antiterminator n=1 Tax=Zophobihabitans entericus TaxID=1635327 RepID=A0A6G9IAM7_9GAMM|nr:PTS sugar transporter subunit IIA [Zophobihabitans entericus]QIQ20879.1 BglG family transcription antiterminator [Zophobihabitans entericus]
MVLFPYQRLAYLFDTIRAEVLPQEELAKRFSVSTRTIRTDILALSEILQRYGAQIQYERGVGYQLIISDEALFKTLPHQQEQLKVIPRTSKERVLALLVHFLTHPQSIKLDDIADEWFISRSTLQADMAEVREYLEKYHLSFDKRPHYGMKLLGAETSIRACLTDIFWQMYSAEDERAISQLQQDVLNDIDLTFLEKILQNRFERFDIKITPEGQRYLLYSCAISIVRITTGQELLEFEANDVDEVVKKAAIEIAEGFTYFLGTEVSQAESNYLSVQIAARCITDHSNVMSGMQQNSDVLVSHLLDYINSTYNYDLRRDEKLKSDLSIHLASMLARIKYQIRSSNPLLDEIKQYYPFAYDITLSAITNTDLYIDHKLSEDEIGYLTVHIGVALERNYNVGYERHPHALLVSDSGNATLRMIEAKIKRDFPQIQIVNTLSLREYELLSTIEEDFVITTVRLSEKNKPIVKIAPFPTPYQLEQLGRLAMIDRTRPYILEKFFSEKFFMVLKEETTQEELFKMVSQKLADEEYIDEEFYPSLVERESIVPTMLGEGIAIPHTVGLLAKKTTVVTILAPKGIAWGHDKNEMAYVIFLLAICKEEYEEAMAIYSLFVNFVKEKATKRLLNSQSFNDFQAIAKDSLGRIA